MDAVLPAVMTEHFRIATTGIVWRANGGVRSYLITKRAPSRKIFPNKWTVPGGGLQKDDFAQLPPTYPGQWYGVVENALIREIREEVDLEVDDVRFLLDLAAIRDDGSLSLILSYYARYLSGEVSLNDESTDFAWITASEVSAYDLIPGIAEEIVQVDVLLSTTTHGA